MQSLKTVCIAALLGLIATGNALGHHAFSTEFDVSKPLDFTGKVSRVELINPHSWIHVDVTDAAGNTVTWMIEGGSPNALVRRGVTKNSVPVGSEIHVVGYQARDGSNKGVGRDITFADGRELFFGGSAAPGTGGEE
ncbi:MAG: hypothetical protein RLZZ227_2423 [Pseudomonadota bacterium]|jgi:hypothetical protein